MFAHPTVRHSFKAPSTSPAPMILTPRKNDIRLIDNNPHYYREKYDGSHWRLVCTWHENYCTNFAYTCKLCVKHNAQSKNKPIPKRKKRSSRLPRAKDDDDIIIVGEYHPNRTTDNSHRDSIKSEQSFYNQFSIDYSDEKDPFLGMESSSAVASKDVVCLGTTKELPNSHTAALIAKYIPPLTEFEEEYLAVLLISNCPPTCSILDAQLYLHNEAISIVKKNYRLKMSTISPEYFYDYLLRYPRVALHYHNWFSKCKPIAPSTGSSIDTKMWSLTMMVRGSTMMEQTDEA